MPEPVSRRQLPLDLDDPRPVETAEPSHRAARPAMEDPLEELARILGESTAHPARPEPPAETGRRGETAARPGPQQLSALEAELFDELRASVTPETRVRGDFPREVTAPIPQHPADDHDIAALRIGSGRVEPEPPRSAEGAEAQWSDFYAYDDGVAAGSYDPAFAPTTNLPGAPEPVEVTVSDRGTTARSPRVEPTYPHATFDEFGRDEIAEAAREAAPLVAAEPRIMPHSREEELAAARLPHDNGGRGLKIAIAAVALVLVGGGALAAWKFTGGAGPGEPVLVRADGKPLKTIPAEKTSSADAGPSLTPDDPKNGTRIVSKQEDPVDQVSGRTPEGKEVRLINPGAQRPSADVPHTVKTVVVRPDGSIVSDGVAVRAAKPAAQTETPVPAPAAQAPAPQPQATTPPPPATVPAQQATTPPPAPAMAGTPVQPTTPPAAVPMPKPAPAAPMAQAPQEPAPPAAAPPKVKTVAVSPVTVPKPAARPTASGGEGAPLSLGPVAPRLAPEPPAPSATPAAPAAPAAPKPAAAAPVTTASAPVAIAPPPPASGGGDYMVQISASGTDAAARASFAAAQRKHSGLAGKAVDVQRADLGAKGVFYRARVAGGSREQAAALCSQIQSQGGQCMVVKR